MEAVSFTKMEDGTAEEYALLKPLYEEEFQRAANEDVEKASYSVVPRQTWIN